MRDVNVATVQMRTGLDVEENIQTALTRLDRLAESDTRLDLVCLPEMMTFRALGARPTVDIALPADHSLHDALSARARRMRSFLVAGYLARDADGRVHNETRVFDRAGLEVVVHRKTHLFDALGHDESGHVRPGEALTTVQADFGTFGIVVCYELRFPEVTRTLALAGAEILVVPNSWPTDGQYSASSDLSVLLAAAAVQNQVYVVHANQVGEVADLELAGGSCVLDPRGRPLALADVAAPVTLTARLDAALLDETRERRRIFAHRRPALYDPRAVHAVLAREGSPVPSALPTRADGTVDVDAGTDTAAHQLARESISRYMELCDVPAVCYDRDELAALFTPDAVWEGADSLSAARFGRVCGPSAIVAMLEQHLPPAGDFVLNMHLLDRGTSVRHGERIDSRWTMIRLSAFRSGLCELAVTDLRVEFAVQAGRALIARYTPERRWQHAVDREATADVFAAFADTSPFFQIGDICT